MDKEVMDECNMCHPQMKAPTLATPGCSPTFARSSQTKDFVGQKLMLCFFFRSQALNNSELWVESVRKPDNPQSS